MGNPLAPFIDPSLAYYYAQLFGRDHGSPVRWDSLCLLDALLASGRYEEAIAVADVLIEVNPSDACSLTKKGTAYYRILRRDVIENIRTKGRPPDRIAYADDLYRANQDAFIRAEALGWREPKPD